MAYKNPRLKKLRSRIDSADIDILASLAKRMHVVRSIGAYKQSRKLRSLDKKRWSEVLKTRVKIGTTKRLSPGFVRSIFKLIHRESLAQQKRKV